MSTPDEAAPEPTTPRAVVRPSPLVVLVALAFAFCATPVAFGAPLAWLIYLIPLVVIVWAVRTRTVVDTASIETHRLLGARRVPWEQVASLRLDRRSRLHAVLTDGAEVSLPAVHVRHLPALAAASGGHLPDPSTAA